MASTTNESPRVDFQQRWQPDEPRPLHIVKRNSSATSAKHTCTTSNSNMEGNAKADATDEPDLAIVKRRSGKARPAEVLKDEDVFSNADMDLEPAGAQSLRVRKTRASEPCVGGRSTAQTCAASTLASYRQSRGEIPFPWVRSPQNHETTRNSVPAWQQPHRQGSSLSGYTRRESCVLCPQVEVTTECASLDYDQKQLWICVEVLGKLARVSGRSSSNSTSSTNKDNTGGVLTGCFIDHELDRFFDHGCLYDLTVDVLPVQDTSILQVITEQSFPTTIYAGSSVLLLAHIAIAHELPPASHGQHIRQKSNELIEDLEMKLGALQLAYAKIRVSFAHSAFPAFDQTESVGGISAMSSRMETVATAKLRRYDALSPWSPRPAPAPDLLSPLVKKHWGPNKARDVMQQVSAGRSAPAGHGQAGALSYNIQSQQRSASPVQMRHAPPAIPHRQTSLRGDATFSSHRSRGTRSVVPRASHGESPRRSGQSEAGSVADQGLFLPTLADFGLIGRVTTRSPCKTSVRSKKADAGRWSWASWF
ncbi:uncharacterized protein F5Z01DRAFT_746602 [Emericellopsis atlantica]|uniref:Uncharacterized protein n=1 Tax=Emericellopsis atlantica TaxID=2614577 RepID=A0A9P7ZVV1_9HYPO|nr:uncharacterized protein F5Z01DRAFT_746602 [Emericellopsis atlantica]KAG9259283.1 hypothetical protein F5Z01DRAFT_746602 [Emericellopsis atlantica]